MPKSLLTAYYGMGIIHNYLQSRAPPVAERFCAPTGRREFPGLILGRVCRHSLSEFSVVLSETRVNTGKDPLEKPTRRAFPP